MKKRLAAVLLMTALCVGLNAWYLECGGANRIMAGALPPEVRALLPADARCEKLTGRYLGDNTADEESAGVAGFTVFGINCYDMDDRLIRTISWYPGGETDVSYTELRYDNAGRQIALIAHNKALAQGDGDIISEVDTTYDENGRAIREEQRLLGVVRKTEFSYDENGQKSGKWVSVSKTRTDEGHGSAIYDEADRIVRQEEWLGTLHILTEYVYDGRGELEKSVLHWDGQDTVTMNMEYTYDAADRVQTETTYENGELKTRAENQYDATGRLLRQISYDAAGRASVITIYKQIITA